MPHLAATLALAVALTAAAGFVDAHVFVHVTGVFVANMSGNVVLFGIFVGERRWPQVAAHLLSIAMFTVGVAVGTIVHDRRRDTGRRLRPDLLLLAEAALLALLIVLRVVDGPTPRLTVDALDYPVIALGALAMGLQTVVVGRVGRVAVATTYESGAVARVGEESALAVRRTEPAQRHGHLEVVRVLGAVLVGYAGGAALAAAAGASPAWLLVPLGMVLAAAAWVQRVVAQ